MKSSELHAIIKNEVIKAVKAELPKMVKPLVQEAVAGALASLLAEGIVKGPPPQPKNTILTPDIPQARRSNPSDGRQAAKSGGLGAAARRNLAEQLGYGTIDTIGLSKTEFSGNGPVNDILNETAMSMRPAEATTSILDSIDEMDVSPEAVDALTKNYSELMTAMNNRGKSNG